MIYLDGPIKKFCNYPQADLDCLEFFNHQFKSDIKIGYEEIQTESGSPYHKPYICGQGIISGGISGAGWEKNSYMPTFLTTNLNSLSRVTQDIAKNYSYYFGSVIKVNTCYTGKKDVLEYTYAIFNKHKNLLMLVSDVLSRWEPGNEDIYPDELQKIKKTILNRLTILKTAHASFLTLFCAFEYDTDERILQDLGKLFLSIRFQINLCIGLDKKISSDLDKSKNLSFEQDSSQPILNLNTRIITNNVTEQPSSFYLFGLAPVFNLVTEGITKVASESVDLVSRSIDYLSDGDHPWKQQKWHVLLQQTGMAIEKMMGRNLDKLISELNEKENTSEKVFELIKALKLLKLCSDKMNFGTAEFDRRTTNRDFITAIRKAGEFIIPVIAEDGIVKFPARLPNEKLADQILLNLAYVRSTDVNIFPFCNYLVNKVIATYSPYDNFDIIRLQRSDFFNIDKIDSRLGANRVAINRDRIKFGLGIGDPAMQSDIPYTLGKFKINEKLATVIHTPIPIIDGISSKASPEFELMLMKCKKLGEEVRYFNIENDFRADAKSNKCLQSLEDKYPDVISIIILDNFSDFYYQRVDFSKKEILPIEFKKLLLERMLRGEGYRFPLKWTSKKEFTELLRQIIDVTFFMMYGKDESSPLSIKDRQIFIENCHALVGITLLAYDNQSKTSKVNVCYVSKNGIDEGIKLFSIIFKLLMSIQKHNNSSHHQARLRVLTHQTALMVKKQAMSLDQRDRLMDVIECLDRHEVQHRIQEIPNKLQFVIDDGSDVLIEEPTCQRPGEAALQLFHKHLFEKFKGTDAEMLLDVDMSQELIDYYINSDHFFDHDVFENLCSINTHLQNTLNKAWDSVNKLQDDGKKKIKKFITQMFYFVFLNPHKKNNVNDLFKVEYFIKLLDQFSKDPGKFCQYNIDDECFDSKKTCAQRMFRVTNFNANQFRLLVKEDELYPVMENSPFLADFIINVEKPENSVYATFSSTVSGISNILEMLIFGEAALDISIKKYGLIKNNTNPVDIFNGSQYLFITYEAIGMLAILRQSIKSMALGDKYTADLMLDVRNQVKQWLNVMQKLREV